MIRESAQNNLPLGLSPGEQKLDLLNIRDAVDAFTAALSLQLKENQPGVQEFYLRSGEIISVRKLIDLYSQVSGKNLRVNWGARPYRSREVMQPWAEGENLPGWKAKVNLAEGLREFANEALP